MTPIKGARARARAEITAEITTVAKRHLASHGAADLSLRAIASELGMASSGIYRYVASRDELLTILIIEAYQAIGDAAEEAAASTRDRPPTERLVAVTLAIRAWAITHQHEYALIYGSPVPGYAAPDATIGPAGRSTLAITGIVADAHLAGGLDVTRKPVIHVSGPLKQDLARIRDILDVELDDQVIVRLLIAWTQIFGLISFEIFGQTRNGVTAHDHLLAATTTAMAGFIGLRTSG